MLFAIFFGVGSTLGLSHYGEEFGESVVRQLLVNSVGISMLITL